MKDSRQYPPGASGDPLVLRPNTGRYSKTPASAVFDHELGHAAYRVLGALGTYVNGEGWCWPSQNTLAKNLGMTRQSVSRAITELVERGHIESVRQTDEDGGYKSNLYRILYSPPTQHNDARAQPTDAGMHPGDAGMHPPRQEGSISSDVSLVSLRSTGGASSALHKRTQENNPSERPIGTDQGNITPLYPPAGGSAPVGARLDEILHTNAPEFTEFADLWSSKFPWPRWTREYTTGHRNTPTRTWIELRVTREEARFAIRELGQFPGIQTERTTVRDFPGEWLREVLAAYRARPEGGKQVGVPNPEKYYQRG